MPIQAIGDGGAQGYHDQLVETVVDDGEGRDLPLLLGDLHELRVPRTVPRPPCPAPRGGRVSAMSVLSRDKRSMRSDPMRLRWLSIADRRVARSLSATDLLEREVLGQEPRRLDQAAIPRVDHLG